jgi:hypothetical protein
MPDYARLKSKIQTDHAADTAAQIEAALNARTIPIKKPVYTRDIKKYLMLNGLWLAMKTSSDPASVTAIDALNLFEVFSAQEAEVYSMLVQIMNWLIAANLTPAFTTQHRADILAMADGLASWADLNWSGKVQIWQIQEALNG